MEVLLLIFFWGFIFWVCWKLFLKKWVNSLGATQHAKATVQSYQIPEEAYYEMAGQEISRGQLRQGLWLKAMSDALGDEKKGRALYIKLRVQAMRQEAAAAIRAGHVDSKRNRAENTVDSAPLKATSGRVVINCPKCNGRLRVIANKHIEVTCAHCGYEFEIHT